MVELVLDSLAGQLGPAAAFYVPASVCPSSQAAELQSDEADGQLQMMEAHLEPQPQPLVPQLHGCCLSLAFQTGVWLGSNVGWIPSVATEREQKELRRQVIFVGTSVGLPCRLLLQCVSTVFSRKYNRVKVTLIKQIKI